MKWLRIYTDSFKGLSAEVWFLSLVTFINRAGTMVIPFLSLYLTEKNYTLSEVGWIMSVFGLGSVVGAWSGGRLIRYIGYYKVMLWSLVLSGILFIALQFIDSFAGICAGVFVLMLVADTFRPALFVAINSYSPPENRTRSVTLIRLAINLGFSMGPAAGGLIIASIGYHGLFWVDGLTCIIAAILFVLLLNRKETAEEANERKNPTKKTVSPYTDKPYLLAVFATMLIGFSFLQYFSTVPLYYHEVHHLSEKHIGWLMAMNGLLIFVLEMPLVNRYSKPEYNVYHLILISSLLLAASFFILNLIGWVGVLPIGMLLMTVGEMLNFPFLNTIAMKRSERGKPGEYMALFTMAFSVSHILGHKIGMYLIGEWGYTVTWYFMGAVLTIAGFLMLWLGRLMNAEEKESNL